MGVLLSCCFKGGYEDLSFGRQQQKSRRQTIQSLLSDRDNPSVDGRKASAPPATASPPQPASPTPAVGGGGLGPAKDKYTGPALKSASGGVSGSPASGGVSGSAGGPGGGQRQIQRQSSVSFAESFRRQQSYK